MVDKNLLATLEAQSKTGKLTASSTVFSIDPLSPYSGLCKIEKDMIIKARNEQGRAKGDQVSSKLMFSKDTENLQFANYLASKGLLNQEQEDIYHSRKYGGLKNRVRN